VVAGLASAQHGVVTRVQLMGVGLTTKDIEHRVGTGALLRVHRGVYRVGHQAPSVDADLLAAVLAGGTGAFLRACSAAHLLGLIRRQPPAPEVATRTQRQIPGVITKRHRHTDPRDITTWRTIPTTNVPRTLVDLAAVLNAEDLARACHEAGVRHRTTPGHVKAVLAGRPKSPGGRTLMTVLLGDVPVTLSVLERSFLELLKLDGLPAPLTNKPAGGRRVDCRWPEHRLTVELDGYRYHASRHAWTQDRRREREARARGDDFRRYTYDDVLNTPAAVLGEMHAALAKTAVLIPAASRPPAAPPRPAAAAIAVVSRPPGAPAPLAAPAPSPRGRRRSHRGRA
jgi:hypothetical protein